MKASPRNTGATFSIGTPAVQRFFVPTVVFRVLFYQPVTASIARRKTDTRRDLYWKYLSRFTRKARFEEFEKRRFNHVQPLMIVNHSVRKWPILQRVNGSGDSFRMANYS